MKRGGGGERTHIKTLYLRCLEKTAQETFFLANVSGKIAQREKVERYRVKGIFPMCPYVLVFDFNYLCFNCI